jgi:hypothetical protein
MLSDPRTCTLVIETVRPYSTRLIELGFVTKPPGWSATWSGGWPASPGFVPLDELDGLMLYPSAAQHLHKPLAPHGHPHRVCRHGSPAADPTEGCGDGVDRLRLVGHRDPG